MLNIISSIFEYLTFNSIGMVLTPLVITLTAYIMISLTFPYVNLQQALIDPEPGNIKNTYLNQVINCIAKWPLFSFSFGLLGSLTVFHVINLFNASDSSVIDKNTSAGALILIIISLFIAMAGLYRELQGRRGNQAFGLVIFTASFCQWIMISGLI